MQRKIENAFITAIRACINIDAKLVIPADQPGQIRPTGNFITVQVLTDAEAIGLDEERDYVREDGVLTSRIHGDRRCVVSVVYYGPDASKHCNTFLGLVRSPKVKAAMRPYGLSAPLPNGSAQQITRNVITDYQRMWRQDFVSTYGVVYETGAEKPTLVLGSVTVKLERFPNDPLELTETFTFEDPA